MKKLQKSLKKNRFYKYLLIVFFLLIPIWFSANQLIPPSEEVSAPYSVHVAFAGGGWRAHTGHAAWTMSLLNNGNTKLKDAFAKVGTISSNSGGSWFNTMLAYSDSFVKAIEAKNAINMWPKSGLNATGWLGQQQHLFDSAPWECQSLWTGDKFLDCVFAHYTGSFSNATYWYKVIEDVVFHNNKIAGPLKGTRQHWAKNKSLLLAATMLTNEVVLGEVASDKQYYQACLPPYKPLLNGYNGASCSGTSGKTPDVTPVTFSSIPSGSSFKAPLFFSALGRRKNGANFNIGYTETKKKLPATAITTIDNPLTIDISNVAVTVAAAASSAAAGFAASERVTGSWLESYEGSDAALNFQMVGMKHVGANNKKPTELATNKFIQLADGGPVDNSGVAQLMSFLQLNNLGDGFNIVAFDNVQKFYKPGGIAANVGTDIAYLFGRGLWNSDQFCSEPNGGGSCVTVPKLQIFKVNTLENTPVTWSAAANTHNPPKIVHKLIYTKYSVTTIDNPTFGIKAATTGTLHAFTAAWSDGIRLHKTIQQMEILKPMATCLDLSTLECNKREG